MPNPNGGNSFTGFQKVNSSGNEFNTQDFFVRSILAKVRTAIPVKVMAVTNSGADIPAGYVNILPLVNQVDGLGNSQTHGIIYKCPYFRLQGGSNAVILDPQVGDIGLACFADRDISSVLATQGQANPGSGRTFDMADGVYVAGFLGQTPTQFVQFSTTGISVVSPVKITLTAPLVEVDASTSFTVNSPQSTFSGAVTIEGLLTFLAGIVGSTASGVSALITGAIQFIVTLTSNGKAIDSTHAHTSETPGTPTSPPL